MRVIHDKIEPIRREIDGLALVVHAVEEVHEPVPPQDEDEPQPVEDPFLPPLLEPSVSPIRFETRHGPALLKFNVSRRPDEGREFALNERATVATGRSARGLFAVEGLEVDAPEGWPVEGEPASLYAVLPLPGGLSMGLTIHHVPDRDVDLRVPVPERQRQQDTLYNDLNRFLDAHPGLLGAVRRGIARMEARILKRQADHVMEAARAVAGDLLRKADRITDELALEQEATPPSP